ncbi:citramalate synthase [bacterium M21]|nr:citramalate synthase [bacterium M21]
MDYVSLYDTTLRDGTQGENVNLSVLDKIRIAQCLDDFGVDYVEGGWPGSNPRDMAFFEEAKKLKLKHTKITAFGCTHRDKFEVAKDPLITTLLEAETPVCTIFGKSWLLHVEEVLRVTPERNLELIANTCSHLKANGREVVYDAEHFFDGYKDNPEYALSTVVAAATNGADAIALCDTNGGSLPHEVFEICTAVKAALPENTVLGIHPHNDGELAVANALAAVRAGARQVQGTINGIGERCGNVNLCSVAPALELKMDYKCLPEGKMKHLCEISRFVNDLANLDPNIRQAYVGRSAFAHKAGVHVDALQKSATSYEHMLPELVGNKRRILVSDYSGGSNILLKAAEHNIDLKDSRSPEVRATLAELKRLEHEGYEYEAAGASFELLLRKQLGDVDPFFELDGFRVIVEKRGHDATPVSSATVKVIVDGKTELSAAEGDGPVNALDQALRKALASFYPQISEVTLRDYKVRILDAESGTAAKTRVIIESTDGKKRWGTVGVNENIIEASWQALVDSVEHKLYCDKQDDADSQ